MLFTRKSGYINIGGESTTYTISEFLLQNEDKPSAFSLQAQFTLCSMATPSFPYGVSHKPRSHFDVPNFFGQGQFGADITKPTSPTITSFPVFTPKKRTLQTSICLKHVIDKKRTRKTHASHRTKTKT